METIPATIAQQIAQAAIASQQRRTGHAPQSVAVILSGETLVVTLHGALSPAERALARSPEGAARLQEFHRQLFATSAAALRQEIQRITGVEVREAAAEVEPSTGTVVQVFSTGTVVQVFLLAGHVSPDHYSTGGPLCEGKQVPNHSKAFAFDLDPASLLSLREALQGWEIEVVIGATAASLAHDWNHGAAGLLVVKAREPVAETLGLCRFLVSCDGFSTDSREGVTETAGRHANRQNQARRADAPLLVLVPPGQESLVRAVLEAGADSCLVLPVHAKEVASMLARGRHGNQPGRHTLDLDRVQSEDRWRDDGGQG